MQCLTAQEASRNKNGCCTYATTEALYIGTTTLQTNMNTSRYKYGRRWHHQNTFDAMPNSSRSSRNKYGCCTYATTEALYIGTTNLQTNMDTSRYDYGRRWYHQNTFDAMPNSSRSKPQQKWMLYLCDDGSVIHGDDKPTNEHEYLSAQLRKTVAPSKYLWCDA